MRGKFLRGTRKSLFRIRFSHSDVSSACVRGAEKALSRCRTAFSVVRKRPFEGAEEAFPSCGTYRFALPLDCRRGAFLRNGLIVSDISKVHNTCVFAPECAFVRKYAALVELACVFMRFAARAYAYLCRHLPDLLGERCGTFRRMARRAESGVACSRRSDRDCVCAAGWGINEKTGSRLLPVPRLSI